MEIKEREQEMKENYHEQGKREREKKGKRERYSLPRSVWLDVTLRLVIFPLPSSLLYTVRLHRERELEGSFGAQVFSFFFLFSFVFFLFFF